MSSLLDRNYELEISLKDGRLIKKSNGSLELYDTDKNIFNMTVKLKDKEGRVVPESDMTGYRLFVYVVRPDLAYREIECTQSNGEFLVEFGDDVWSASGKYNFEFKVKKDDEELTSSPETFTIKNSITTGLTQTYSLDFVTLSNMVQENTAIDDVKFDGKTMYFYSSGECVRRLYLDKAQISMEELVANEPYTAGKGIKISKNGVISMDTNVIRALIKETVKEGE